MGIGPYTELSHSSPPPTNQQTAPNTDAVLFLSKAKSQTLSLIQRSKLVLTQHHQK